MSNDNLNLLFESNNGNWSNNYIAFKCIDFCQTLSLYLIFNVKLNSSMFAKFKETFFDLIPIYAKKSLILPPALSPIK